MNTPISFEFFPPKYENGKINLLNCITEFKKTNPEYMSVTFGAGGSTQSGTLDTVLEIQKQKIIFSKIYLYYYKVWFRKNY